MWCVSCGRMDECVLSLIHECFSNVRTRLRWYGKVKWRLNEWIKKEERMRERGKEEYHSTIDVQFSLCLEQDRSWTKKEDDIHIPLRVCKKGRKEWDVMFRRNVESKQVVIIITTAFCHSHKIVGYSIIQYNNVINTDPRWMEMMMDLLMCVDWICSSIQFN